MKRRHAAVLTATAVVGLVAAGVATTAGAAIKKNEIRIVGGEEFKAGKYVKVDMRFKPLNKSVKSGATVTLRNKGEIPEPHTITFVEKRFMPKSFDVAVEQKLLEAHQVDMNNPDAPPGVLVVDNGTAVPEGGMLQADTGFTPTRAGDSAFIAPDQKTFKFKVAADKGSKLFYYCAIHAWMQGKLTVK
jgi:plastocyanin